MAWFEARSSETSMNVTTPTQGGSYITHQYKWPKGLNFSHINITNPFDPTSRRCKEGYNNCFCSAVPWGINPQGIEWFRPDNSLTWDPRTVTPPWYLTLPPCANCKPGSTSVITRSPLVKPTPIVTWNVSLAVNISSNQTWYSFYYPALRVALISSACHSGALPVLQSGPPERARQAFQFSGNCAQLSTPTPLGMLWACSDGCLYTTLPATLSGVQCFLTTVSLCPPLYAITSRPPSLTLLRRHKREPVWSSLSSGEKVEQFFKWGLEGSLGWGILGIGKARVAIAQLAEQVELLANHTAKSLNLLNRQ
ncbi:bis(5'-adenosyl)-triphosphatase isoform X1 [Alligator sinensis]|uniref:Bis(5'-adenosyl)-triphosphatase isoform X1 n=1 Tax=Alligator sinensis TaxID=38654 RepID=A0A1U7RKC4_ALLSI|nr:bis(5'-adenosyl)-triphosphatase isoform X1 [Alligator sinensis]XP_006019674.1 bis(5'-adenosyl)-triphosphatase isoform X1 [Alligator sinensis]XP_014373459.1 bis(5'-adenosyl)-triphosphatase isoform X1 [Alligator sinensis]XP_025054769.1 bis(5'-adenosyl)-triphosphatase isoform X1 [Alligator sinensis]XP_025054770.1 bis(5'-adenosyl)-triphosphatase isoform X1 [Alligator sinensis]XP_025054772.1 bis(5'-adenosyl)-triphosphatase isoform X1 [Alligator sinensis]